MSLAATLESFVKHHLDGLPVAVKKNMEEIRRLDIQCQTLTHSVQQRMRQLTKPTSKTGANRSSSEAAKRKLHESLTGDFAKLREISDAKIALAEKTYATVDKCIQQLDNDTQKFNANVRKKLATAAMQVPSQPGPSNTRRKNAIAPAVEKGKRGPKSKGKAQLANMPDVAAIASPVPLQDMPVDPNEPRYCSCNQVSFGEMVMCDGKECPIEWFHFQCVGLASKPKGKWYCERCSTSTKSGGGTGAGGSSGAGRKRAHSMGGRK